MKRAAHAIAFLLLAMAAIVATAVPGLDAAPPADRTLSLYNIHTRETVTVTYRKAGKVVPEAKAQIDWILRDWRRDEATEMDVALIDLIWEMHAELGSKEPVHVISGFRSRSTNDMLRKSVGGQASESRHILGKAADVQFPDVPLRQLRYSALIRERGGVGYYPSSAAPFVHVDTGAVRHWPRLPRQELALLFPDGRTRHQPADGGPITRDDARAARTNTQLAHVVAEYHAVRSGAHPATPTFAVADAGLGRPILKDALRLASLTERPASPPMPQLVAAPRLVEHPSRFIVPTEEDKAGLTRLLAFAQAPQLLAEPRPAARPAARGETMPRLQLAALDPAALETARGSVRLGDLASAWAPVSELDEEHADELSYRPFPVAPLLTATASIDDPALAMLEHPDTARVLELIADAGAILPMRLRPGLAVAERMADPAFRGEAINPAALPLRQGPAAGRTIRTAGP